MSRFCFDLDTSSFGLESLNENTIEVSGSFFDTLEQKCSWLRLLFTRIPDVKNTYEVEFEYDKSYIDTTQKELLDSLTLSDKKSLKKIVDTNYKNYRYGNTDN